MRIAGAVVALLLASSLDAQHRGSFGRTRTYGSTSGFGNILYPGVGTPPMGTPSQRRASAVPRHRGPVYVPYAYPIYMGGGYGDPYYQAPPPQPPPNITVIVTPPAYPSQPAPVIINQGYMPESANPVMRRYSEGELPQSDNREMRVYEAPSGSSQAAPTVQVEEQATIYLIAYKDGSVFPAYTYWVKDDTVHYVTIQGSHNRASVSLIDKALTERLNRERSVEFSLTQ